MIVLREILILEIPQVDRHLSSGEQGGEASCFRALELEMTDMGQYRETRGYRSN